jgi:hypothetical protein
MWAGDRRGNGGGLVAPASIGLLATNIHPAPACRLEYGRNSKVQTVFGRRGGLCLAARTNS